MMMIMKTTIELITSTLMTEMKITVIRKIFDEGEEDEV